MRARKIFAHPNLSAHYWPFAAGRYVYIDLRAALERFGQVFDVGVDRFMHLPEEKTVKLPVYRSEQLAQMTERSIAPVGLQNDPAALFSLNAAAPEAAEPAPPPAEEDDEHLPVEEHVDEPGEGTAPQDGEEAR